MKKLPGPGDSIKRREFLQKISASALLLSPGFALSGKPESIVQEPLLDWSLWEKYRKEVVHPALSIKAADIANARENIRRYRWAANYSENMMKVADHYLAFTRPESLRELIEEATPGDPLWTPCPSCRAKGKPVHPHGLWHWDIEAPDRITCTICEEVFPNEKFPEDIVLKTRWGKPQAISYYGGEPFVIFGFTQGRPSFTANIRSRKVQWIANYARILAEAFALTDKAEYALGVRNILLRLAECYPNWLVHVGYGEYADMDPKVAAQHIVGLPVPELTPPPNQPDKRLWTGFWSAGRASGVGLESDFVRKVAEAYDLTCSAAGNGGKPAYSEDEKIRIEKDLLLESTTLLVCDKQINNKSVSNRTAVALVGLCTGHPGLVRFGLEGFRQTVEGWFLEDGTTSESPFYGLMTLGGIWDFAQASKGYSDPKGYKDDQNKRFDKLDLYRNEAYSRVWEGFFNGLQGDLTYPAYADSFRNLGLDRSYAELMAANYPDKPEYLSLLKELCGQDLAKPSGPVPDAYFGKIAGVPSFAGQTLPYDLARPGSSSSFSLFYRKPYLAEMKSGTVVLKDWNPPGLRIGHMRTGVDGRESLLTLSASHWGKHHESDSLNLYYWKNGAEIWSDLGYLWDHPRKYETTMRTFAHNTLLIDGMEQRKEERGGVMHHFHSSPHVRLMEASSEAYAGTSLYRRTSAIIDHGDGLNYVVDFFLAEGGEFQDFVFHTNTSPLNATGISLDAGHSVAMYDLQNIRKGLLKSGEAWSLSWKASDDVTACMRAVSAPGEEVFVGDGWGQRDWKNSDVGTTIPYVVRRQKGAGIRRFVSVLEGHGQGSPFVKSIRYLNGVLIVETGKGYDYMMSAQDTDKKEIPEGYILSGHFACVSIGQDRKVSWAFSLPR